jgi:hypothetical protein
MKKLFVIAVGFMLNLIAVNAQPAVLIAEYRFDTLMIPPPALTGLYGTSYRTYMNPFVLSSAGNFYQSGSLLMGHSLGGCVAIVTTALVSSSFEAA